MIWVGLTGGIATGKSTAAQMLREMGFPVIDADELARRVVVPGHEGAGRLRALLGSNFFTKQGELKRRELAQHMFAQPQVRLEVEKILHPLIRQEVAKEKRHLLEQGSKIAFYDVPLLFEKKLQKEFDATLLIYAPEDLQRERLKKRESWSDKEISERFAAQLPIESKKTMADYLIENVSTLADLRSSLKDSVEKIKHDLSL